MERVFAFNWIAIPIYSRPEGVSAHENTVRFFNLGWRWRGLRRHTTSNIYIYKLNWLWLTWLEAPFHVKYKSTRGSPGRHPSSNIYLYVENLSLPRASESSFYRHLPRRWERRCLNNYYHTNTVWIIHCSRRHGLNKYITTQRIDRLNNLSTKWHTTEI